MTTMPGSKVLARVTWREGAETYGWKLWCPGCDKTHVIPVAGSVTWAFDGNEAAPTFSPSVKITYRGEDEGKPVETVCHFHVRNGFLEYCGDCTHALAGMTVPMVGVDREPQT